MKTTWLSQSSLPDLSQAAYAALPNGDPNALLAQFEPSLYNRCDNPEFTSLLRSALTQ